jgi:molybdate transport system permease protein
MLKANWARMPELLVSDSAQDALRLSLETAAISTALCIVLGGPLAAVLARGNPPALPILRSVVLLPLVLPPVVGGLALLYLLGRSGFVGKALDLWFGITVPFTDGRGGARPDVRGAAVPRRQPGGGAAHGRAALRGRRRDARRLADAGLPAGHRAAGAAGLASGTVLAFARCLGEFGATTAFAGSLQGTTRTLPLLVYLERETDVDAAVALSLVLGRGGRRGDRGDPAARLGGAVVTGLDAHVVVRRPDFTLDVTITATPGEVIAVLGPQRGGASPHCSACSPGCCARPRGTCGWATPTSPPCPRTAAAWACSPSRRCSSRT